jgi:hypothetical protein
MLRVKRVVYPASVVSMLRIKRAIYRASVVSMFYLDGVGCVQGLVAVETVENGDRAGTAGCETNSSPAARGYQIFLWASDISY